MKGYNSLKQFVDDYRLYIAAKKIDPGREGETITLYLKKRIDMRLANASKQFKSSVRKRGYSKDDLKIIALHDHMKRIHDLEFFIRNCFGINYAGIVHYRKLLSSNAFKAGRLCRLYEFIPLKIENKVDFLRFIKAKGSISKAELSAVMSSIAKKEWKSWLNELIDSGRIRECKGRWSA